MPAGKDISTWHDIPLYLDSGLVSFICEIPKETSAKLECATVSTHAHGAYNAWLERMAGFTSWGSSPRKAWNPLVTVVC
jgi:hypothetical protein